MSITLSCSPISTEVYSIDCTYSARCSDERTSRQLIQALRGVSNGQTRNRGDDYETTAYWDSKETRLRKLKAYLKTPEFMRELEKVTKCAPQVKTTKWCLSSTQALTIRPYCLVER